MKKKPSPNRDKSALLRHPHSHLYGKCLCVFAVLFGLLTLSGCNPNLLGLGPSTGGTGPITASAAGATGKGTGSSIFSSSREQLLVAQIRAGAESEESLVPTNGSKADKKTYTITTQASSAVRQTCGGLAYNMSLMDNDKPVQQHILKDKQPIRLRLTVKNISTSTQKETRYNCQSFDVTNKQGKSIVQHLKTCATPEEVMEYQPRQEHTYHLEFNRPSILKYGGNYRVLYTSQQHSVLASRHCKIYLDLNIKPTQ